LHTRFRKGQSGNPGGRRAKSLPALLAAAPPPEPRRLAEADEEVVQQLVARLRRQVLPEIEEGKTAALLE
jgi:hypothetical protein